MGMGDLIGVDGGEAVARYLRAAYETVKPARRPKSLFEQMQQTRSWLVGRHSTLDDIIEISAKPLPDYDRFVEDLDRLFAEAGGQRGRCLAAGSDPPIAGHGGLEELARAEGKKRPRAYLDWFTALEKRRQAPRSARRRARGAQRLPAKLPIRAAMADHLCAAAAKLKETQALRAGRWEAFLVKPVLDALA